MALLPHLLLACLLATSSVTCFLSSSVEPKKAAFLRLSSSSSSTRLFGINEWRDLDFNLPGRSRETLGNDEAPPRSICILPFPYQEVLLQGETKQLRLYEDRFIKLFQNVVENHASVVGMGLMADSGIIQTMPLCEVEASINTLKGTFGIFVTIRVVGRASLLEITQQEPYLRGACIEVADVLPPNLELPNLLANNIENHMLLLSSMEQRFKDAKLRNNSSSGNNNTSTSTSNIVQDEEMATRIALAKLEDRFYASEDDDVDDDDLDDDDDDDVHNTRFDRRGRYRQAYQVALSTDTQGYSVTGSTGSDSGQLSAQELTATSWAAFCSEIVAEEDATYRIQALDTDKLFERLKLAAYMLREKMASLEKLMTKEGIKFREKDKKDGDDNEDDRRDGAL